MLLVPTVLYMSLLCAVSEVLMDNSFSMDKETKLDLAAGLEHENLPNRIEEGTIVS